MTQPAEPVGSVATALAHANRLLQSSPNLALAQATEILKAVPNHPVAILMQGLALGQLGQGDAAVATLLRALQLEPRLQEGWLALADHLTAVGDTAGADAAYAQHIRFSTRDPQLLDAAAALCEGRLAPAEAQLRAHLKHKPTDVAAIRMLAEVAARLGRYGDAEKLLARCLELAPGFDAARQNYAVVLYRGNQPQAALLQVDLLLQRDARNPGCRNLKAAIKGRLGEYDASIELYGSVLADYPQQPKVWTSYGHALKTAGRQEECVAAYRRAIELMPQFGEAWWSLANLKTFRFTADELRQMQSQLLRTDLTNDDRLHFHFSIGKALEDAADYAGSFEHYAVGNRLRRGAIQYDSTENHEHVLRSKRLLTREFFAARAGMGSDAPDPIFIVGLPRAGSTLLEQILASHSAVEGTMELPDIIAMARTLGGRKQRSDVNHYPEVLATLDAAALRALGQQYIEQTRVQRKTSAPYFIDKMPNNFAHTGLIHLILPNAKIIDARRHPMGCCFSGFKQHFARGQTFTYDLGELGRYYRDYVELMAHYDAVLPGRVHRVIYEQMIDDTEAEVRCLLDYCGLPFEDACLQFYRNDRAVRTASSEQVRQPIFRDAVDHWRFYEPWLSPLRDALGSVLDCYPAAPKF